jgi:6-phosphogluconate dehydrogenase
VPGLISTIIILSKGYNLDSISVASWFDRFLFIWRKTMENIVREIGFLGLGRMGGNMVERILKNGKTRVVVWNRSDGPALKAQSLGAIKADSPQGVIDLLESKRKVVWLMLPAGEVTELYFEKMLSLLKPGDVLIDGANSNFHDTIEHHKKAKEVGIQMLDVGVSGGIVAAKKGYPMMIGGETETWELVKDIFHTFGVEEGYDLVGPGGAGHYVKMIHNAIEYGMMQAISEGFELLKRGRFEDLDLKNISHIWNHGTIVSSFLMEMVEQALSGEGVDDLIPHVDDSGEGRWAVIEAVENRVPFSVNTQALNSRFYSQERDSSYQLKMLAAMRREFGGHGVKK